MPPKISSRSSSRPESRSSSTTATSAPACSSPTRSSSASRIASSWASAASRKASSNTSTGATRLQRACRSPKPRLSRSRSCASRRSRLRIDRRLIAAAALAAAEAAHAGAQQYEVLSASVRAALANAVNDRTPVDEKDLDTRAWVRAMTKKVVARFPDEETARHFLAMARYEAMRAGLDPHLVLAVIDVESKFRKYA